MNITKKSKQSSLSTAILAAMFLAIGLILPFVTGQIPQIGNMLLPMHLPVFLCGLLCGPLYGLVIGLVLPLLRFMIFGMPILIPIGVAMCFELAAYGLIAGIIYNKAKKKNITMVYVAIVTAMIFGRIIWGVARTILAFMTGPKFSFQIFISAGFVSAIPGIVLQLILIPIIISSVNHMEGRKRDE